MEPEVREARSADLVGILEVYNHYVLSSPATFEIVAVDPRARGDWMEAHLHGGPHRLFVATDPQGHVVGWASTTPFRPRPAYRTTVESSVYCRPEHRGRGVGSMLYRALFRSLLGEDVERIVAGITLPNRASTALHSRFGFRHVGTFTRVGRKFGRFWDVAWFERPVRLDRPPEVGRSAPQGPPS